MVKLKPACIFSDRMVMQRQKELHIFGEVESGSLVEVTLLKESASFREEVIAKATAEGIEGRFHTVLPPQEAGTGYRLIVRTADQVLKYTEIAMGEVFLAGGQSNMEFMLKQATAGVESLEERRRAEAGRSDEWSGLACPNPIRYFRMPRNAYKDEQYDKDLEKACWEGCDADPAEEWSAVAFFFAEKLADTLDVPVGIIGCNLGGTSIASWMSRDVIPYEAELVYRRPYEDAIRDKTDEEQAAIWQEYMDYYIPWQKHTEELYRENPSISWDEVLRICGENRYPGPLCNRQPRRPGGLYECMLRPIAPYSMRGFLFYQGEDDVEHADLYECMLKALIRLWRVEFRDESLWFHIVQLPGHHYEADDIGSDWAVVREAQKQAARKLDRVTCTSIIDCGEINNIHPVEKRPVGSRLALTVLSAVYRMFPEHLSHGPVAKHLHRDGENLIVEFDSEYPLCIREPGSTAQNLSCVPMEPGRIYPGLGFEIAGADGHFLNADAVLEDGRLKLRSVFVPQPVHARYLWTDYPDVCLYGQLGEKEYLPAVPFADMEGTGA